LAGQMRFQPTAARLSGRWDFRFKPRRSAGLRRPEWWDWATYRGEMFIARRTIFPTTAQLWLGAVHPADPHPVAQRFAWIKLWEWLGSASCPPKLRRVMRFPSHRTVR